MTMNSLFEKNLKENCGRRRLRTLTSLGSDLTSDDMIIEDREREKQAQQEMDNMPPAVLKLGQEFKSRRKEFADLLILKTRFKDTTDRKVLLKRRDDWIKDLNMNLIRGKVVRSTLYFEELKDHDKIALLKALESEPGQREVDDCKLIEPFIRSMSFFKPYAEFESSDFAHVVQEINLHKVRAGSRVASFGETADSVYVVVAGRIAITHPNQLFLSIVNSEGQKGIRERA